MRVIPAFEVGIARPSRAMAVCFFLLLSIALQAQDTTKLSLLFIGDIMQHDTQIAAAFDATTAKYNYTECFQNVKPIFESADVTIGNLELTLGGAPYKGYPAFSAPDELLETLTWSGVDVLVTANNHCLDRGKKGLQRTIAVLDTFGIPHTGTFIDSVHRAETYPLVIEKNSFRICLLNYTYGTNGLVVTKPNIVNYIDTTQIASDIIKAKEQQPDFIIAFFHWGDEYQRLPNKAQKSIAEFCFKKGVKLVIGSHPHVLQPFEWRKDVDQLVVYSLGNFVSGQSSRYRNGGGMLYVEMKKTDSVTSINQAEYTLQFVYRDAARKYHIVPVQQFEADTTLIAEKSARAAMREFASDSRKLLGDFKEVDSVYFIVMDSIDTASTVAKFYGVKTGNAIGEFYDRDVAVQALLDIRNQLPNSNAVLMRRRRD